MNSEIRTKKSFGQRFLKYSEDCRRIAELGPLPAEVQLAKAIVLEIGPGSGALTTPILERYSQTPVTAVEFDRDMVSALSEKFRDHSRLSIIQADILKFDPQDLGDKIIVFGNLPYNISSPVLEWTCKHRDRIQFCAYMLQREVAARVISGPGSKDWSPLGIMTQLWFDAKEGFGLGPERFSPPPKVHSTVITLSRRDYLDADPPPLFEATVRASFRTRRKIMSTNLKTHMGIAAESLLAIYSELDFERTRRAEETSIEEFVALSKKIEACKTTGQIQ